MLSVQQTDTPYHARRRHRGHRRPVLTAVREILADGKPRTTEEIIADGRARGLLSHNRTVQDIAMAVHAYIGRKSSPAANRSWSRTITDATA